MCLNSNVINKTLIMLKRVVDKNKKSFTLCVNNTSTNRNFLFKHYDGWEPETHAVLDKYLHPDKCFVDIGAWIGPLTMYASLSSKHVYSIEADPVALQCLNAGIAESSCMNVTVIDKALCAQTGWVCMTRNLFRPCSALGDSTSQVKECVTERDDAHPTPSCSVKDLEAMGLFDNASIVKVDIEGGEQHVILNLLRVCHKKHVPLYVSFHLTWWSRSPGLTRFEDVVRLSAELFPSVKCEGIAPFESVLFM